MPELVFKCISGEVFSVLVIVTHTGIAMLNSDETEPAPITDAIPVTVLQVLVHKIIHYLVIRDLCSTYAVSVFMVSIVVWPQHVLFVLAVAWWTVAQSQGLPLPTTSSCYVLDIMPG